MSAARKHSALAAASVGAVLLLAIIGSAGGAPAKKDREPPSLPTDVRQTLATPSSVALAWKPSTDNVGVVAYEVRGEVRRARVTNTTYVVDRLRCGESHSVWVTALDRAGNRSTPAQATVATAPCVDTTPPTPPTGFRQTAATQDAIVLVWDPSTDDRGVVGYGVYQGGIPLATTSEPAVTVTRLSCGTVYELEVDAHDAAGNRSERRAAWVETAACSSPEPPTPPPPGDTTPPTQPTSLAVTAATQSSVSLRWSPSSDDVAVVGYGVYRDSVLVSSVSQPSAAVSGLVCGTTYTFAVDAHDAAGNRSAKAAVRGSTAACSSPEPPTPPPPGDTTPPTQPTSLAVTAATQSSVSLRWSPSSDDVAVVGYGVYRDSVLVSSVSQPSAAVSGLVCGTTYTFAVDAHDAAGNRSAKTSVAGATAACPDIQSPTAPSNVHATSRTATSIALSWSASSDNVGVAGYGLYRAGALVGTTATTSGVFSGLTCNTNYTLAVDAYDVAGNRSPKSTIMVATASCPDTSPPTAPTGLSTSNVSQSGLTLSWSASTDNVGVAGYDVHLNSSKVGTTTGTSYAVAGLTCGTSYVLGVVAFDAAGNRSVQTQLGVATSACSTSSEWTFCANEGGRCNFVGTKEVRYGANATWTTPRVFTDGVNCNNQVFGDPLVGVFKRCEMRDATTTPPPSGSFPHSYYTGPLGQNNILPSRQGAFLFVWPTGSGWPAQRDRYVDLENRTGRRFDGYGVHYGGGGTYGGVANCMWNSGERREQWIHDRGAYPLVSWSPDVSLDVVRSGAHDACFRAAADYFKSFSFRIMLRLWWEFNGNWMPWSGCGQVFIDAWRRVVGIFKDRGATNVGFWWSPQEGFDRTCSASSYPGDQYVDWVGSDAYNWCYVNESSCWSSPLHSGWAGFGEILNYGPSSAHDTFGPRKPFVVGETNTVFDPANPSRKGEWYRNVASAAKQMRYLVGVQLFEVDVTAWEGPRTNWSVDYPTTVPSVFEGFVALARDPYFNTRG